ncbi:MAG: isoleucine--tRNA ligase [archaeon]
MAERYDAAEIEQSVLTRWEKAGIYGKAKARGKKKFYFLDGPPYTSGKIHLGIAWNKSLKDAILRYKRMQGYDVWDRAGYDMHGLPTALKVQEKFKISHKDEIPKFGVARFIDECKKLSLYNMEQMNRDFNRLGVWMDFKNPYMSIRNSFIEGEWWLVKKAHQNKRLYEGEKVMHWCAKCATALAKHELEYYNVKDDSIFFKFRVENEHNEFLVIWTTTPWTVAFNLGVMANPELDYVKARVGDEIWIMAKALAGPLISGVCAKKYEIVEEMKGIALKGMRYRHPFSDFIDYSGFGELSHTVVMSKEYVNLSAGSGLVHLGAGCGPEDYEVAYQNNIKPFNSLDEFGVFPKNMGRFSGLRAKKDDKKFIEELDSLGLLLATTKVEHDYAHCWRCKEPVIFRTTKQWFFKIEDLKKKMRELNKKVKWIPDWAGSRQFDSWLDNLRDNGITRQRYWGSPVPIWRCGKCSDYVVVGSCRELKKLAGRVPEDLHKPHIDRITIPCKCGGIMRRIPDILDVWIDSGSASWGCLDYPHKDEFFEKLFPADFILEGKDQIRGWFNLLLVASIVSMSVHSYKAVYMHGFVMDALGRKMSKSLGNIISPYEVVDKYGADTFRFYMIGGASPGLDINYNFDDVKIKHRNLSVLWNVHQYLMSNARTMGVNPAGIGSSIEKDFSFEEEYIFSKLHSTIKHITFLFESYRINEVPWHIEELFLELSRTYMQLTRDKMAAGEEGAKVCLYTVFRVLHECLKIMAPLAPFITDAIYFNLREEFGLKEESVHLLAWPVHVQKHIKPQLEHSFEHVKGIIQAVLFAREKSQLGVRWPVKEFIIETDKEKVTASVSLLKEIIKTQTNARDIDVVARFDRVSHSVKADYSKIGPDFGSLAPAIIARLATESANSVVSHLEKDHKFTIKINGQQVILVPEHVIIEKKVADGYVAAEFSGGTVYLNTTLDKELEAEGYAREVTRRIQSLRKEAGLEKQDRIELCVKAGGLVEKGLKYHLEQIKEKVGASEINIVSKSPTKKYKHSSRDKIKNEAVELYFNTIL